ncbi:HD-like signal output (HDOD) protein [Sphaerotilus hippei]|uniref:HD-like signal output (HDOD) protein n=1 Tax=Sphaerotilus hippei TaxID=744406 RepID=A0A318H3Z6_9BURK|nr:HDOD domain-containing protein [Sphaerotilus hippei]PXW98190.1 HD-like signal output (HDOD) protein [Sphaerotilus hippei]
MNAPLVTELLARTQDVHRLEALIEGYDVPPQPGLLVQLRGELARARPRTDVLVQLAAGDVAIASALMRTANTPLAGLLRPAGTLRLVFERLGAQRCISILTDHVMRQVWSGRGPTFERFWDVASKRGMVTSWLAQRHGEIEPDVAHTFGLFCDVGIPLLMQHCTTPSYQVTLAEANLGRRPFTDVERGRHGTDHAAVGAALAHSWGIDSEVVEAVSVHHDYRVFVAPVAPRLKLLVALGLVADRIIQCHTGLNRHAEWQRGGDQALRVLGLTPDEFDAWADEVYSQLELSF